MSIWTRLLILFEVTLGVIEIIEAICTGDLNYFIIAILLFDIAISNWMIQRKDEEIKELEKKI